MVTESTHHPPRCAIEDSLIAIVTDMNEVYPAAAVFRG